MSGPTARRDEIPGWEGTVGPFPGQYGKPHVYARDIHSGSGNCVCGRGLVDARHVQAAPGVPIQIAAVGTATLTVPDGPKMLRETLCSAQAALAEMARQGHGEQRLREHLDRIQSLIAECDRHRPLGPDGKHGNRHTSTCGCEDK